MVAMAATPLNPRVGPRVRPGVDPAALPSNQRAQAEPHIARNPRNPDELLATFQEGRFTDGGALGCGYAHSTNGGISWTRAWIPGVTKIAGGTFDRATDPVAAYDALGNGYLCTLGLSGQSLEVGVLLLSQSTNGGATFTPPREVYRPASTEIFPDKNWCAINTRTTAPFAGRIAVTFTRFVGAFNPLAITTSDDQGLTWTLPSVFTPADGSCQGSQPAWLPDGSLVVVYWNFQNSRLGTADHVECVRSLDGGQTFGPPTLVNDRVRMFNAPVVRNGAFLPSAAVAQDSGAILVCYQAYDAQFLPRVMVQRSLDSGATWSAPLPVSDNLILDPAGLAPVSTGEVFNPAIGVSPDGNRVVVAFFDTRIQRLPWVDTFAAESVDGGVTWGPNLRLTDRSTDVRLAPLTGSGYMLGDYLGVVAPINNDTPALMMSMAEQDGDIDPLAIRWGVGAGLTFGNWRAARWSYRDIQDPTVASAASDADHDGFSLLAEYVYGLNPFAADPSGAAGLQVALRTTGELELRVPIRAGMTDFRPSVERTSNFVPRWDVLTGGETLLGTGEQALIRHVLMPNQARDFFRIRMEFIP